MTLKAPRSANTCEPEETQSLLHFRDLSADSFSRFQRLWFAAETEKQHLDWHSKLSLHAATSHIATESTSQSVQTHASGAEELIAAAEHFIRGTVAAGRVVLDDSRSSDSNSSTSSTCSLGRQCVPQNTPVTVQKLTCDSASCKPAGPSPIVAYRLCGPGQESGELLLRSFKDMRRTLEQGTLQLSWSWHILSLCPGSCAVKLECHSHCASHLL